MRPFIEVLRKKGELVEIEAEVDPNLEIAEIHRRVIAEGGPALLFKNVKGSAFPVVTNLFGSPERIALAFPKHPEELVAELVQLLTREFPPKLPQIWQHRRALLALKNLGLQRKRRGPVMERQLQSLEELPMLKSWPEDGGHFLTLPLVYTEPPGGGPGNLGMYRIQRFDGRTTGLHWQIAKGGGFHHHQAELLGQPLPVSIFLGGPPALMLSAIAPLPENVPELLLASFLHGRKLRTTRKEEHLFVGECEFALLGEALPGERRPEGPFGDHYGYYSLKHDFPVFHCKKIYARKDAIYPATIVGKPRQEDFYIGDYLQKLLSPLFPVVMPGVKALWSYGETGFHSLSAAIVRDRHSRECMTSAFRILGEGQLSLTKFLVMTDQDVNVTDFRAVLTAVLERFRPETDLYIFANLSLDTLDYTGPELNKGSRGVMLGVGEKIRDLPREHPRGFVYCPGCLVVDHDPDLSQLQEWPLIIRVSDLKEASDAFLWTVFTRFEPAADISAATKVHRHHCVYSGPIVIDARMKPSYPDELICDDETAQRVTKRWNEFFPRS